MSATGSAPLGWSNVETSRLITRERLRSYLAAMSDLDAALRLFEWEDRASNAWTRLGSLSDGYLNIRSRDLAWIRFRAS